MSANFLTLVSRIRLVVVLGAINLARILHDDLSREGCIILCSHVLHLGVFVLRVRAVQNGDVYIYKLTCTDSACCSM